MNDNININDSDIKPELTFRNLCFMYMKQLINFPYIEKDFDALTDYQLLCLVVKYLNKVIDNSNKQNESITNLYNAFLQLQDYMNNSVEELEEAFNTLNDYVRDYFANLDVQEEINNKLDQMLEDGVLEQIIEQFIQSTTIWCFDTVADMRQATNLINGSFARTLGYYSINDGGGALYKITNTESQTEYQEEISNNLYATLISNNEINLMNVGCYGDGVHDDTIAIQNALSLAYTLGKNIISSDNKEYLITENLTIPNINIHLDNCTFKTDYTINVTSADKQLFFPRIISVSSLSNNTAINLLECYTNEIKIPYIQGFTIGLQLSAENRGCCYNQINIIEIINCLNAIRLTPTNNGWVNENMLIGGRLFNTGDFITAHGNDIILIYLKGIEGLSTNNNYFLKQCVEGNEGASNGLKIKMEYARYNVFESLRYEGNNPKVDATNSLYNLLSNGYNLSLVTFPNDEVSIMVNGTYNKIKSGGSLKGTYLDITPSSNTISGFQMRTLGGVVANKITNQGLIFADANGDDSIRYNNSGMQAYYDSAYHTVFRNYGNKYLLFPSCDFTNRAIVINSGANLSGACFLWIYNGHLYGKMGQPSSESDGTIIL